MPTGITTTTTFNSMSTLAMYVWCFLKKGPKYDVVEAGRELGFSVKFFPADDVCQLTFLKGWFMRNPAGRVEWIPLPSACLKIGKLLNDPCKIVKTVTIDGIRRKATRGEAIRVCAFALSQSYGCIPDDYPIFGAFLRVMRKLGLSEEELPKHLQESWKPRLSSVSVSREVVLDNVLRRYGITVQEVVSVEALLESINFLPALIEHPVFELLCKRDYE